MSDFHFLLTYFKKKTLTLNEIKHIKNHFKSMRKLDIPLVANATDEQGNTLLHYLCKMGHTCFFADLAEFSPDLKMRNHQGETAFHFAFDSKLGAKVFHELNSIFLKDCDLEEKKSYWEQKNKENLPPLFYALNNPEGFKALLEMGIETDISDEQGNTLLHHLCKMGHTFLFEDLAKFSPDLKKRNHRGETVFHLAFDSKLGAKVFHELNSIFLKDCDLEEKKSYWEQKNKENLPPLFYALNNPEGLKALLGMKVKTDIFDNDGVTPLHCATREGNLEAIKLLLAFGANPYIPIIGNARQRGSNNTLIATALAHHQTEVAEFFINNGFAIGEELPEEIENLNLDYTFLIGASIKGKPITPEFQGCDLAICNVAQIKAVILRLQLLREQYLNFEKTGKLEETDASKDGEFILAWLNKPFCSTLPTLPGLIEQIESKQKANDESKTLSLLIIFKAMKESLKYFNVFEKQAFLETLFSFPRAFVIQHLNKKIKFGRALSEAAEKELTQTFSVPLDGNLFEKIASQIYFNPEFDQAKKQLIKFGNKELMSRFDSLFLHPLSDKEKENKGEVEGIELSEDKEVLQLITLFHNWVDELKSEVENQIELQNEQYRRLSNLKYEQHHNRLNIQTGLAILFGLGALVLSITALALKCKKTNEMALTPANAVEDLLSLDVPNTESACPTGKGLFWSALASGGLTALFGLAYVHSKCAFDGSLSKDNDLIFNFPSITEHLKELSAFFDLNFPENTFADLLKTSQRKDLKVSDVNQLFTDLGNKLTELENVLKKSLIKKDELSESEKALVKGLKGINFAGYHALSIFKLPKKEVRQRVREVRVDIPPSPASESTPLLG